MFFRLSAALLCFVMLHPQKHGGAGYVSNAWLRGKLSTAAAGSGGRSMQPLINDQPQPACGRPKNNSGERADRDHHGGPKQAFSETPLGREFGHCYLALRLPQSSSASRFTAGAFGFLT